MQSDRGVPESKGAVSAGHRDDKRNKTAAGILVLVLEPLPRRACSWMKVLTHSYAALDDVLE